MNSIFIFALVISDWQGPPFLPPNDLHKQDQVRRLANMTEAEFHLIIKDITDYYRPIVESHGAQLTIDSDWNDSTVNAYAQQIGTEWNLHFYGGLARRSEVTDDGFALVVCHELGHHLGGFPFYGNGEWAASEGQSDYFATQICLKNAWKNQTARNASFRSSAHPIVKSKCDQTYSDEALQDLCYRIAMAGLSTGKLMAALGSSTADLERHDPAIVKETYLKHPAAQCRLDTYLAGALCTANFSDSIIPGKNQAEGQVSLAAEQVADQYSCAKADLQSWGSRPLCWFAPKRESVLASSSFEWTEIAGNGDPAKEPGEVWALLAQIKNSSSRHFDESTLKLATSSSHLELLSSEAHMGSIAALSSQNASQSFLLRIKEETACHMELPFQINYQRPHGWEPLSHNFLELGQISEAAFEALSGQDIPESSAEGIASSLDISDCQAADKIQVHVDIRHPYVGDLKIELTTPTGDNFLLRDRSGGASDDINETYTLNRRMDDVRGAWSLRVMDIAPVDTGTLNKWGLSFKSHICR